MRAIGRLPSIYDKCVSICENIWRTWLADQEDSIYNVTPCNCSLSSSYIVGVTLLMPPPAHRASYPFYLCSPLCGLLAWVSDLAVADSAPIVLPWPLDAEHPSTSNAHFKRNDCYALRSILGTQFLRDRDLEPLHNSSRARIDWFKCECVCVCYANHARSHSSLKMLLQNIYTIHDEWSPRLSSS